MKLSSCLNFLAFPVNDIWVGIQLLHARTHIQMHASRADQNTPEQNKKVLFHEHLLLNQTGGPIKVSSVDQQQFFRLSGGVLPTWRFWELNLGLSVCKVCALSLSYYIFPISLNYSFQKPSQLMGMDSWEWSKDINSFIHSCICSCICLFILPSALVSLIPDIKNLLGAHSPLPPFLSPLNHRTMPLATTYCPITYNKVSCVHIFMCA